ncbi:MAG: ADP-ribosylglycohydrolase family protein [Clostridia bacterium]|nr:ADP-ribosylglycohydrolase family protein [Clostridia bacterium]
MNDREYKVLSKADYIDKTTAGFIGHVVGVLTGYEFVTLPGTDRGRVGMPDDWFDICAGPYAGPNPHKRHTNKLIKNEDTGLWESWVDDDYGVDVFNQFMLKDMYKDKGTVCQKYITDGWLKCDIYDMGGGNRYAGAYAYAKKYGYLPQFAGNTEFGNKYSYCTEPYLGADTIGMDAAGMPESASEISGKFASMTGERDNVGWARFFAVLMSRAYFENDIPALIRTSAEIFDANAWHRCVIDEMFELYAKHPDDWRAAYTEFEEKYYVPNNTRMTNNTINCGFVILDLLYGGGDYMETCKISALSGYDCESTCGIALSVVAIMTGMKTMPEKVNRLVWQDGEGVITNLSPEGLAEMYWMHALALPERFKITEIVEMYRENFESILKERGGYWDEENYYIPNERIKAYDSVKLTNSCFECGDLTGWTVARGKAEMTSLATVGLSAVKLTENGELRQRVSGLKVGEKYMLTAFVMSSPETDAYLFAGDSCVSINRTAGYTAYTAHKPVLRELVFTATSAETDIGVSVFGDGYSIADDFSLVRIEERAVGTASIADGGMGISLTCETDKEAYLRLDFENASGAIVHAHLNADGEHYCGFAFRKTAPAPEGFTSADCVYLPVTLGIGEHKLTITVDGEVSIKTAGLVTLNKRF